MPQITSNALAYAGFRAAGGPMRALYVAIAYGTLVIGIVFLMLALEPRSSNDVFAGMARFLLGAQAFVLCAYTCFSVINNIQRDNASRMLESHRLMPVDPRLAVLGYMAGAASPTMFIVLFNFIFGGMAAGVAGLPLDWWVAANIVLVTFAAFCWSLAASGALYGNLLGLFAVGPIVVVFITGGAAGLGMPPLLMLTSPWIGSSIFRAQAIDSDNVMLWTLAILFQAAVASVIINIGARRFRQADATAFTPLLAILLVALLAAAGAIAARHNPSSRPWEYMHLREKALGTLIILMLVGGIGLASCVRGAMLQTPRRQTLWTDLAVAAIMALCAGGFAATLPQATMRALWSAIQVGIALTAVLLWARVIYRKAWSPAILFIVLLTFSLLPIIIAVVGFSQGRDVVSPTQQFVMQISPFAAFAAIWTGDWETRFRASSIVAQALLLLIPAALLWRGRSGILNPSLKAPRGM